VNVIAIKKKVTRMVKGTVKTEEVFNVSPSPEDVLEKGAILVIVGREEDLERFSKLE
jgi:K+/H+ antiporter YhaU regulatory subunit KhtT